MAYRFAAILAALLLLVAGARAAAPQRTFTNVVEWSPDGRWLAFDVSGETQQQVHVVRVDGTRRRAALSRRVPIEVTFAWSPDSRRLAIIERESTWLVTADGRPIRRVAGALTDWSRDGKRFLVTRAGAEVWVVERDGRRTRKLLTGVDAQWSPDERLIAFSRPGEGTCRRTRIFVADALGRNERQIGPDVAPPSGAAALDQFAPRWSPGGRRLAYAETRIGNGTPGCGGTFPVSGPWAFVVTSAGQGATWVGEGRPFWSPRGDLIALIRIFSSPHTAIVTPQGRELATFPSQGGFDWAPTRGRIATSETPSYGYVAESVRVGQANGRSVRRLTEGISPSWSPDGRWIAFVRHTLCGDRVMLVRPSGTGAHAVTRCR